MFDREQYEIEQANYLEDNEDLFVYYNHNPNGKKVNDCVKRAISLAYDIDYKELQLRLNRYKKRTGAAKFNENRNWTPYLEKELKAVKLKGYHRMKVGDFAKSHKEGTYIISIQKHLTVVKDGKVYDTWNCSFKAIGKIWKVERRGGSRSATDITHLFDLNAINSYINDQLK